MGYLTFKVLHPHFTFCSCLEVVEHLQHDFNPVTPLSQIFPYVNNIHFCALFADLITPFNIVAQSIRNVIEVWSLAVRDSKLAWF